MEKELAMQHENASPAAVTSEEGRAEIPDEISGCPEPIKITRKMMCDPERAAVLEKGAVEAAETILMDSNISVVGT